MAQLSINELTTYRWSFEQDVAYCSAAEVPAIGVWRQKLSDYGEEKGAELLAETGIAASSLLWAGGFTGDEGRTFVESVADGREAIQTAAIIGAPTLIVYSGARAGHTRNHARRLLRNALAELAPLAAEEAIELAIEPMHIGCGSEWTFLSDFDETIELISSLEFPNPKLAFDTYNWGFENSVVERLAELTPWIASVQLGDGRQPPQGEQNRCPLGEGSVPLDSIVNTLLTNGYDGFFDVKLMGEDMESIDYHELIKRSKEMFEAQLQARS